MITMQDAQTAGDIIEDYIIHDADITGILNELRGNGAEAISINGERILGTSKLVCAGPTIFLNKAGIRLRMSSRPSAIPTFYTMPSTGFPMSRS